MPITDLEYWYQVRDQADVAAQISARAIPTPRARSGHDESNTVRARVDAKGMLTEVYLSLDWERRLGDSRQLAGAVREAIQAASAGGLVEMSQNLEALSKLEPPRARPTPWPPSADGTFFHSASDDRVEFLQHLVRQLDQLEATVDAALAASDRIAAQHDTVRSRRGEVEVTVGPNGVVESIRLDPAWLRITHPTNIGRIITDTVNRAQRASLAVCAEQQAVITQALSKVTDLQHGSAQG